MGKVDQERRNHLATSCRGGDIRIVRILSFGGTPGFEIKIQVPLTYKTSALVYHFVLHR